MIPDTNEIATEAQASHIEKPKSICVSFSLLTIPVYTAGPISKSSPVYILIIFIKSKTFFKPFTYGSRNIFTTIKN